MEIRLPVKRMTGDKKRGTGGNLPRRETQHPTAKPINKLFRRNSICFFVDCAKQRVLLYAGASSHEHRIKKGDKKEDKVAKGGDSI